VKVLALHGWARSGKDTAAAIFKEELTQQGYTVVFVSFAEKLKQLVHDMWCVDPIYAVTEDGKAFLRPKYIRVGQMLREIDPYVWVDHAIRRITVDQAAKPEGQKTLYVITDLRFFNEIKRLIAVFGEDCTFLRIITTRQAQIERMGPDAAKMYFENGIKDDPSEAQLTILESFECMDLKQLIYHSVRNDRTLPVFKERLLSWANESLFHVMHTPDIALNLVSGLARIHGPEPKLLLGLV
jgi:hypothetical protein